jgi:hypothetical protein
LLKDKENGRGSKVDKTESMNFDDNERGDDYGNGFHNPF